MEIMKGIICGNGTLADDPRNGSGVQHFFDLHEEVRVLKTYRDTEGRKIRYLCRNENGSEQLVMIKHFKEE